MSDPQAEIKRLLRAQFSAESARRLAWDQLNGRPPASPPPLYDDYELTVQADPVTGLLAVAYHTVWWYQDLVWLNERGAGPGGLPLFNVLSQPALAGRLAEVVVTADDEDGINGTQDWSLHDLLSTGVVFPALRVFALPLNEADTHNRRIVSNENSYEEGNALGQLLSRCPALQRLAAPSAPGPGFFERAAHGLTDLQLQCGYDHQGFIGHLARSTCFPGLARLEFRDYAETYMDDYEASCVPLADYRALVSSATLPALRHVLLLDTVLSAEQQAELTRAAAAHGRELRFGELA